MIPEPLQSQPYVTAQDAPSVLALLGLNNGVLMDSVRTGVARAQDVTAFHPVTARGYTQWSETVAYLRQELVGRQWAQGDPQNSPRVFSRTVKPRSWWSEEMPTRESPSRKTPGRHVAAVRRPEPRCSATASRCWT